jgi:hypothetical protein
MEIETRPVNTAAEVPDSSQVPAAIVLLAAARELRIDPAAARVPELALDQAVARGRELEQIDLAVVRGLARERELIVLLAVAPEHRHGRLVARERQLDRVVAVERQLDRAVVVVPIVLVLEMFPPVAVAALSAAGVAVRRALRAAEAEVVWAVADLAAAVAAVAVAAVAVAAEVAGVRNHARVKTNEIKVIYDDLNKNSPVWFCDRLRCRS